MVNLNGTFVVDNLRPVFYENTTNQSKNIGLIAHEVQEQYPFLVSGEKDGEETQTINYTGLIGILIKEIKDLKCEMNDIKNEMKELKNKLCQ